MHAVNGLSYQLNEGETLAILGESGSGKSVTAQAVMGILDTPAGQGHRRRDPLPRHRAAEPSGATNGAQYRGSRIAMIFQDALSALNPVLPGRRPDRRDAARAPRSLAAATRADRAVELMDRVRIPSAAERAPRLPAPVLRRHAPAHHDRHGPRAATRAADRRRAHHRARRHRPGPDHGAARRPAARDGTWASS